MAVDEDIFLETTGSELSRLSEARNTYGFDVAVNDGGTATMKVRQTSGDLAKL